MQKKLFNMRNMLILFWKFVKRMIKLFRLKQVYPNLAEVFAGAFITDWLDKSTDAGNLGRDFAFLGIIIIVAMFMQLYFLRPTHNDFPEGRK